MNKSKFSLQNHEEYHVASVRLNELRGALKQRKAELAALDAEYTFNNDLPELRRRNGRSVHSVDPSTYRTLPGTALTPIPLNSPSEWLDKTPRWAPPARKHTDPVENLAQELVTGGKPAETIEPFDLVAAIGKARTDIRILTRAVQLQEKIANDIATKLSQEVLTRAQPQYFELLRAHLAALERLEATEQAIRDFIDEYRGGGIRSTSAKLPCPAFAWPGNLSDPQSMLSRNRRDAIEVGALPDDRNAATSVH